MIRYLSILILFISTASFALTEPNRALTPGRVDNKVTKQILCSPGYLQAHSTIPADVRAKVMKRYNVSPNAQVDIDNLVSVEVGGSFTDVRNLWPQDVCPAFSAGKTCFGIQEKNLVEANLYQRICSGQISMADAQDIVRSGKWIQEYKTLASSQIPGAVSVPNATAPVSYPVQQQYNGLSR